MSIQTNISSMVTGDKIPCRYIVKTAGQVGTFSELGTCTAAEISVNGTPTPDGKFYLIMTGYDSQGRKKFVADRNIQTSISWDTLNSAGFCSGIDISLNDSNPKLNLEKSQYINVDNYTITQTRSGGYYDGVALSQGLSSGKFYFEVTATTQNIIMGATDGITLLENAADFPGRLNEKGISLSYYSAGTPGIYKNGVRLFSNPSAFSTAIGMKIDMDNKTIEFLKDGISLGIVSGIDEVSNTVYPFIMLVLKDGAIKLNLGQDDFKYPIPEGYKSLGDKTLLGLFRLPTGGISTTDTDNEWDKIIVNSDLNGKIMKGDDTVWHWSGLGVWTSTTGTTSANRISRGGSLVSSTSAPNGVSTSWLGTTGGFRPVILVEDTSAPVIITKYMIQQGTNLYDINPANYTTQSTNISELNVISESLTDAIIEQSGGEWNDLVNYLNLFKGTKYKILKFVRNQ